MNKITPICVIGFLVLIHCFLALLYCTNQIPSHESINILTKAYSIHYTEGIFDFSFDTIATLVTTIPIRLYEHLLSPAISVLLLRLASFFILFVALKSLLHRNTMLWFSAIYLLAPWMLYTSNLEYIAFLELGTACYLLSVVKMNYYNQIDNNASGQRFWLFLHLVAIGWCAHFHYAWVVLALTSVFLLLRRIIRLNLCGLISGFLVTGITFLPIFLEPSKLPLPYDSITSDASYGYGLIHVYPMLKSMLYWLRFSSTLGTNGMLFSTDFSWMSDSFELNQIIRTIWLGAVYAVGSISLAFSLASNYLMIKQTKGIIFKRTGAESSSELLSLLALAVIASIVIYAAIAPHLLNSSELIICFDFALIPVLLFIDKFYKLRDSYHYSMVCVMAVFLLFLNIFPAINSESYSPNGEYIEQATDINNNQFN